METIKVNMTPCKDVQTIHASQNDNEAREWGFELHNNGDVIDASEISDQLAFKVYKDGTEQILPENGAVPVTAPFVGDIKYPDATRTDQEFLYRESPTEEDGYAKIETIYGNTLVWNQLVQNGNFADGTNNWTSGTSGSTISVANGELTVTINGAWNNDARQSISLIANHKYLGCFSVKGSVGVEVIMQQFGSSDNVTICKSVTLTTSYQRVIGIATPSQSSVGLRTTIESNASSYTGQTYTIKDVMFIDLTQMGLDITDPSDFTSLFPLSYYSYNQGSLLSFNGNGIKTVGKNRINIDDVQIGKAWNGASNTARAVVYAPCFPNTQYTLSFGTLNVDDILLVEKTTEDATTTKRLSSVKASNPFTFITNAESHVFGFQFNKANISASDLDGLNLQIEFGSSASSYEPYTSSTLSLPISTYFPNGMNGFGGVYDELTSVKAITRYIRRVFDGTENWTMETLQGKTAFYIGLGDGTYSAWNSLKRYCVCDKFYATPYNAIEVGGRAYGQVALTGRGTDAEFFADFQTVAEWKTWLSNNPTTFVYEAKTVTEVSFTTASLVTENAEIPLSNEDGTLIGKCTEELSAEPGFHDAKIKLSDGDGTCYSNKIQLHVERSPQ